MMYYVDYSFKISYLDSKYHYGTFFVGSLVDMEYDDEFKYYDESYNCWDDNYLAIKNDYYTNNTLDIFSTYDYSCSRENFGFIVENKRILSDEDTTFFEDLGISIEHISLVEDEYKYRVYVPKTLLEMNARDFKEMLNKQDIKKYILKKDGWKI